MWPPHSYTVICPRHIKNWHLVPPTVSDRRNKLHTRQFPSMHDDQQTQPANCIKWLFPPTRNAPNLMYEYQICCFPFRVLSGHVLVHSIYIIDHLQNPIKMGEEPPHHLDLLKKTVDTPYSSQNFIIDNSPLHPLL